MLAAAFGAAFASSGCDPTTVTRTPVAAAVTSGGARSAPAPSNDPVELVREGRMRFEAACARCHGGEADAGSLAGAAITTQHLEAALHVGADDGGLLPAVAPTELSEAQLPALRAYLRSIGALRSE